MKCLSHCICMHKQKDIKTCKSQRPDCAAKLMKREPCKRQLYKMHTTACSQPALLQKQRACLWLWQLWGWCELAAAGHSLAGLAAAAVPDPGLMPLKCLGQHPAGKNTCASSLFWATPSGIRHATAATRWTKGMPFSAKHVHS